jgi:hypothetical protein
VVVVATGVASISPQGIDDFGQPMIDVVFTNSNLGEYVDPNFATLSYGFGVNPTPTGTAVIASGVTGADLIHEDRWRL